MYYEYMYGWSGYQCRSVAHSGSSSIKFALPSDRLANLSELEMDTTPQKSAESAALSVKEEDVTPMANGYLLNTTMDYQPYTLICLIFQ